MRRHAGGPFTGPGDHDHRRLRHPVAGAVSAAQGALLLHPAFRRHVQDTVLRGVRLHHFRNSAKSLEEVLEQYKFLFTANIGVPITDSNILLTQQDIKDIIAFLRIL